jgi:hypothetical protein
MGPNVWTGNFVNARHHLIQFPEVVKYAPHIDMFVVLLGLNDFLCDLHIHHALVTPAADWWRQRGADVRPRRRRGFGASGHRP